MSNEEKSFPNTSINLDKTANAKTSQSINK